MRSASASAAAVTAGGVLDLTTGPVGLLVASGGTLAAPIMIAAGSGPVTIAAGALVGQPGAIVDLSTSAGGVSEAAGGTIVAARLASSGGITGNAGFNGTANAVATLADMAVTGTLALVDSAALTLAGTVTAATLLLGTPGDVTEAAGAVLGCTRSPAWARSAAPRRS